MKTPKFTISKLVINGNVYFTLWIPAFLSPNHKRQRVYFKKRFDAERRAIQLRQAVLSNRRMVGLTEAQEADAIRAIELMADNGLQHVTLRQAVETALPLLKASAHYATLGGLFRDFQEFKREVWSDKSKKNFKFAVECVLQRFGADTLLQDLRAAEFGTWMEVRFDSPAYRANVMRTLSPAFNWAVKRGVLAASPLAEIEKPRVLRDEICVLAPDEAAHAMRVCPLECRAAVAVMLFGGVRPAETGRLRWGDVRDDFIHLRPGITKTAQVRNVEINSTLAAWLDSCARGDDDLPLVPAQWERKYKAWRAAAGISGKQDILRHSYATYHLAHFRDEAALRANLGHSRNSDILFRHYRAAATPAQAAAFWAVLPGHGVAAPRGAKARAAGRKKRG